MKRRAWPHLNLRDAAPLAFPLLVLCAGCGPSKLASGQAVILASVPITLTGMLLHMGLGRLWRRLDPSVRIDMRISWHTVGGLIGLCIAVVLSGPAEETGHLVFFALWLLGSSYASVYLIVLRLAVTRSLRVLLPWAVSVPWLLFLPPAIYCAAVGSPEIPVSETLLIYWMLPGLDGYVPAGLLLILAVELMIRIGRARRLRRAG